MIYRGGLNIAGGPSPRGTRSGTDRKGGAPLALLLFTVWLVTLIIAPVITQLLALAVSRKREYLADAAAAQFTRNPLALASALEKIEDMASPTASIRPGSAHFCIADPLGRPATNREGFIADLFATHPPMALQISRLKAMAYQGGRPGD